MPEKSSGNLLSDDTDHRLVVTLLTGFLGAGKTTCLNAWLKDRAVGDLAVLVNEFGAIDVDGAVLAGSLADGSKLVTLPNGCICCAVQEDLAAALLELAERPGLRACVIETTGLADPGAILRGLRHDPRLRRVARAGPVLTVCAADTVEDHLTRFPEPARQIGIADRIVLGKTDIAGKDRTARVRDKLAGLNPLADIVVANTDADRAAAFSAQAIRETPPQTHEYKHDHAQGVTSFTIELTAPLEADRFRDTMSFLIMRHAENLLRMKGVVRLSGSDAPQLINLVHDVWAMTPLAPGTAAGTLVIIGQNLPEAEFRADIQSCRMRPAGHLTQQNQQGKPPCRT